MHYRKSVYWLTFAMPHALRILWSVPMVSMYNHCMLQIVPILFYIFLLPFSSFCFNAYIMNVKHGSSAFIRLSNKSGVLVDAGNREAAPHIIKFLKDHYIDTIKIAVISHPDINHIGGFEPIIQSGKFIIKRVVKNRDTVAGKTYRTLMAAIKKKRIPVITVKKDRKINNVEIKNAGASGGNLDHRSLVVYYTDFKSIAIMGDADAKAEKKLFSMKADILVLGSNGAATATSEEFLDSAKPEIAVISVDRKQKPSVTVLQRLRKKGITCYRTDKAGDIELSVYDWTLRVNGEELIKKQGIGGWSNK